MGTISCKPIRRAWFLFRTCPHRLVRLVPTLRVGMHTRTLRVRVPPRPVRNKNQIPIFISFYLVISSLLFCLLPFQARADIVTDGTRGPARSLSGPDETPSGSAGSAAQSADRLKRALALPGVEEEIDRLSKLLPSEVMLNESFRL